MRIFGKDGDGYELTIRLENAGSLREWLGAASYAKLMPYLASQATWHSFMNSTSSALLNLQMRVRALLFDKAAGCVYEDFGETITPSSLNPAYLQLNGNAVYFPLDQDVDDFKRYQVIANRTSSPTVRHQLYSAKGQVLQGQYAHNGSRRNLEDDHEGKGGNSVSQQRHASQSGRFNNMINSKQETSKPSLNKVKKVEAWDSSDGTKRPIEMIGTINKKLRTPKISSKATFQTDGTGIPLRDHQDKIGSQKITGAFARNSEEPSKVSTSAISGRVGHATDTGDVGPLWYDQCAKTHVNERMQLLAQRAAQQKLPFSEREGFTRTPEGMVAYIEFNAKRQKTMNVVKQDPGAARALSDGQSPKSSNEVDGVKGDAALVPDLKFIANCIPDNPVPAKRRRLEKYDERPKGLMDNLDELQFLSEKASKDVGSEETLLSSGTQLSLGKYSVAVTKDLSPDSSQADRPANKTKEYGAEHMLRQTVAKLVEDAGFEGLKQSSLDLFVDVLDSRFKNLSTGLRGLIDSYRRQCSQAEYLKMFIQISGSSMDDMMEQVKEGAQKQRLQEQQRLEEEQLQLQRQQVEQDKLLLQQKKREEEELQQQNQQREEEELQQQNQQREEEELHRQKQQREKEKLNQQKLQQEQLLKRQAEETQSPQQHQNSHKQQPLDQHQSPRRSDQQHLQQQQPQQKVRQPEKQPLHSPQHQQQQPPKQRQLDQMQQQQLPKQRQPEHQHSQQQHQQKQRQPEPQQVQQPQQQPSHFTTHKKRPQQTQSPSRQTQPGKPAGMRSPPAPSATDSVLKQPRKACSETMEQHQQKTDQVMGVMKPHPQKMSQMSMLTNPQKNSSVGNSKGLSTKSPDAYSGLLHQRQPVPQQSSGDKGQKRKQQQQPNVGRHSPNMGRNPKKVDKERALDGNSLGESRPMVGKKAMQMMSGGNPSSWHQSIPMVKSQTSSILQHVKQQASSLQP